MNFYHCTSPRAAGKILREGYYPDYSPDLFSIYWEDYGRLLEDEDPDWFIPVVRAKSTEAWLQATAQLRKKWLRKFGHGTMIWVSKDTLDPGYGDVCFEVRLPKDAKPADPRNPGNLYWIPRTPIPASRFRKLSDEEIERLL